MRFAFLLIVLSLFHPAQTFAQWEPERTQVLFDIYIPAGHKVEAATCFLCSVRVEGEMQKDAVAEWGDVDVTGKVGGDIIAVGGGIRLHDGAQAAGDLVSVFGDTNLGANTHVAGDVVASIGDLRRAPTATVGKDVTARPLPLVGWLPSRLRAFVLIWLTGAAISLPLAGLSLAILRRRRLDMLSGAMRSRRWRTVLFGVVLFGLLIAALEIVGETNYADWLELPLCILIALLAAPGYTALSLRLGNRFTGGTKMAILIGTILLVTLQAIPIAGWILAPIFMIFSIGSLLSAVRFPTPQASLPATFPGGAV